MNGYEYNCICWQEYKNASDVYRAIVNDKDLRNCTIVITGRCGPTGKTTLCKLLNSSGVNSIELPEQILNIYAIVPPGKHRRDIDIIHVYPEYDIVLVILDRLKKPIE